MDLVRWKPSQELTSLRKEMDSLWNRFLGETPTFPEFKAFAEWQPMVDVSETKDKILVTAELPGLESKDIEVSMSDDFLTIKGEKKTEKEEKDEHYHCVERYHGSFQRTLRLSAEIKPDKVEAEFDKGVLKITLPKSKVTKKKEIEIKVK